MIIFRIIVGLIAIALIIVGTVGMISPVPFGFVLILIGLVLLALVAPGTRPLLKWIRRKWPWLDRRLDEAQENSPSVIADPLSETDPCPDGNDDSDST